MLPQQMGLNSMIVVVSHLLHNTEPKQPKAVFLSIAAGMDGNGISLWLFKASSNQSHGFRYACLIFTIHNNCNRFSNVSITVVGDTD